MHIMAYIICIYKQIIILSIYAINALVYFILIIAYKQSFILILMRYYSLYAYKTKYHTYALLFLLLRINK